MDRDKIVRGLVSIGTKDLAALFETFRQQQYNQIRSCKTEEDRIKLQSTVQALDLIEHKLKTICESKKFSA